MVKTFEIDLDDALVENASEIFEALGTDIDSAIKIFLTQATLRQGFPFEVVIPIEEEDSADESEEEPAVEASEVPPISPEVAARVAANEALVAQMREEIGDKAVTPEFDENEDDGTHGDYEANLTTSEPPATENLTESETATSVESETPAVTEKSPEVAEIPAETANPSESSEPLAETANLADTSESSLETETSPNEDEEEDETTPDNLFDAWDVGEEEDIGCR